MKVHSMMMCSKLTLVHRLYWLPYFGFERTEPEKEPRTASFSFHRPKTPT